MGLAISCFYPLPIFGAVCNDSGVSQVLIVQSLSNVSGNKYTSRSFPDRKNHPHSCYGLEVTKIKR